MKTILIIIAGMADLPDPLSLKDTPLTCAQIPALDTLARRGSFTSFPSLSPLFEFSHKNALLSILGYDLQKGEPSLEELMEFGLDASIPLTHYETLSPFIIPGFSGHGVAVTTSAWVRGVAKCAFLSPLDIYSPGSSDAEILETIARLSVDAITKHEFVLVYVDSPLKASLRGNYDSKVKALETIDSHLIRPIADFVWKSELLINMAVTTDLVTPWHRRRPTQISVPAILYYNGLDWEGDQETSFTEVESMLKFRYFNHSSDLIRYLCNYEMKEMPKDDIDENLHF